MLRPSKYPRALRERAVRLMTESVSVGEYSSEFGGDPHDRYQRWVSARRRRCGKWVRQAEIDGGRQPGKTTAELAEIRECGSGLVTAAAHWPDPEN